MVKHIMDGENRSEQTELSGIIRLEQSGVKASGEKNWHIGAEIEHRRYREEPCQNRKENCSEKVRADSEKSCMEQIGASSVVHNNTE